MTTSLVLPFHRTRIRRAERIAFNVASAILIVGAPFLIWYYAFDGRYVNKVITFNEGIDPMQLHMVKEVYHAGEIPQFYTAYCKNRDAVAYTHWTLINAHPHYDTDIKKISDSVPACHSFGTADTKEIPESLPPGEYHMVGKTTFTLPGGRERVQYYQTDRFLVE